MFHLILTACLAVSSAVCLPILLPEAETADQAACEAAAARITADWLAKHPDLRGADSRCVPTDSLPVLPLTEIAPGVHVYTGQTVQMEETADGRIANLGVVIGARSVAVIDAGVTRRQGQELYAAIRALTDLPVSHVILTHMHPDHVLGASVFREAGARIVGHAGLPLALELRAGGYLDSLGRLYPPQVVLGTEAALPDMLVEDMARIDLGGRALRLRAEATAHTDNDLTVLDERTGTLFTGDLLFRALTPVVDGSLRGWLKWGDRPPDPMPRLVVPGHGPVAPDWGEAVAPQQQFLRALAASARASIAAGTPMSAAVPKIVKDMRHEAGTWNSFEATVARDATVAYKELEWE